LQHQSARSPKQRHPPDRKTAADWGKLSGENLLRLRGATMPVNRYRNCFRCVPHLGSGQLVARRDITWLTHLPKSCDSPPPRLGWDLRPRGRFAPLRAASSAAPFFEKGSPDFNQPSGPSCGGLAPGALRARRWAWRRPWAAANSPAGRDFSRPVAGRNSGWSGNPSAPQSSARITTLACSFRGQLWFFASEPAL